MTKEMGQSDRAPGTTTIAPSVLITIARLTALSVSGVSGMSNVPGGVNRLFKRGAHNGVRIDLEDNLVSIDLYLILSSGVNVREVSRNVQTEVTRAIEEMVGMEVSRVDVHIEEIDFEQSESPELS